MLKDLAVESGVLAGLFFFVFLFVPKVRMPYSVYTIDEVVLFFLGVLAFLGLAVFQLKRLLDRGKTKHAVVFIAILIAIIVITSVVTWILSEPKLM
jgi:uncharacterized membrane protein YhaH (DUF805 family)